MFVVLVSLIIEFPRFRTVLSSLVFDEMMTRSCIVCTVLSRFDRRQSKQMDLKVMNGDASPSLWVVVRAVLYRRDSFVTAAIQFEWFPEGVIRELIHLISSYFCTPGMQYTEQEQTRYRYRHAPTFKLTVCRGVGIFLD